MKHFHTIITILLNLLFCSAVVFFYNRNSFLRPYAGSPINETISALMTLGAMYANCLLLYPKLYLKHIFGLYWILAIVTVLAATLVEWFVGYKFIVYYCYGIIADMGLFKFSLHHIFLLFGRNFAFSFIPIILIDRKYLQKSLENEVRIVYQDVRKVDVTDPNSNIRLIPIQDIFYCQQKGNFTAIHTIQNNRYTRLGSMKHLEQLFGNKEFIRVSNNVMVPFEYIESCKEDIVLMKNMSWTLQPLFFKLDSKRQQQISEKINAILQQRSDETIVQKVRRQSSQTDTSYKSVTPPQKKLDEVLFCIKEHPGFKSVDISVHTGYSVSTVERCLSELRKQGLIEHLQSKKTGGYFLK